MAKKVTKVFRKHMKSIKKIPGPRFLYKDIKNLKKKYIMKKYPEKKFYAKILAI